MFRSLILDHFRCFRARRSIPLAPLTLLVGENSSGKSSVLSSIRLAWDIGRGLTEPDFNQDPFALGAYDQIANYTGGRIGRATSFSIGYTLTPSRRRRRPTDLAELSGLSVLADFRRHGAQPRLHRWTMEAEPYRIQATYSEPDKPGILIVRTPQNTVQTAIDLPANILARDWQYLTFLLARQRVSKKPALTDRDLVALRYLYNMNRIGVTRRPRAIAPIRTRPRRTYDSARETPEPEGGHVPMVLARTFTEPDEWKILREGLEAYGQACGLFEEVRVRRLGHSEGSPFQLLVKVQGPPKNLVDVGYGVSQALPILVDGLLGEKEQMFLLQQPEVHLHPRAQAELGTFLSRLVAVDSKWFVVETHSDYLLDRVCMEVRNNILSPSDVVILFFERCGSDVVIHPLRLDERGNIRAAPRSYRRFFLEEEQRFLLG